MPQSPQVGCIQTRRGWTSWSGLSSKERGLAESMEEKWRGSPMLNACEKRLTLLQIAGTRPMATAEWRRRKKLELFNAQGGLCHWCKQACRMPDHPMYWRSTGALSGKAATIDHLYSRLDPRRNKMRGPQYVMACSTCNGKRSKKECLAGLQKLPNWRAAQ